MDSRLFFTISLDSRGFLWILIDFRGFSLFSSQIGSFWGSGASAVTGGGEMKEEGRRKEEQGAEH